MKIFIDPGHGGKDPGAVYNDIYEKNIALSISLFLKNALLNEHFKVKLSREDDTFVTLDDRVKDANSWGADLFISIHVNSSSNETAQGTETLVFKDNPFAYNIQKVLVNCLDSDDRGVKQRYDLFVLKYSKMDALLVETGFLSNPQDKAKLSDIDYHKILAQGICNAIIYTMTGDDIMYVNVTDAINHLHDLRLIKNPDYWNNAVKCVKYLDELIINMANRI